VPLLAIGLAATLVAASCGSSKSSSGTSGSTGKAPDVINLGFVSDMQVPDPDIFYEIEGNAVVTSLYEGLVRYKPNSTEVEPAAAESFNASPDGLTYTFKLRSGVSFHDGTKLDSAAAKFSFERRTKVNSAPAYMLADVSSYDTPDAQTLVVHLKNPVSAFLDYLAAPYGPKMVSPTLMNKNAGSDDGQTYLKTHDAGTGPFQMGDFVPGDHYDLARFDNYWGGKPQISKIHISILPDISTQRLKLEGGELQMILHGLSKDDIASYENNSKYQIVRFPALFKSWIMVNSNKGIFKDQNLRVALASAVDKKSIVDQVYGKDGAVSTQFYPAGELPEGMAKDSPALDPSKLANAVKGLSNKKVDIGYSSDDARNQRVAELVQTVLQAAGLNATVRGIPIAQIFDLPNHADQAPDLLLSTVNPDAAHPDTWARIFSNTKGSLNWLLCSVPAADTEMDAGLQTTDKAQVQAHYAKAGDLEVASGCFISIADVKDVVVSVAGYSNWVHQLPSLFTVRFGDLKTGAA
jgi:peptide/nickel transport system substrate-binding protein